MWSLPKNSACHTTGCGSSIYNPCMQVSLEENNVHLDLAIGRVRTIKDKNPYNFMSTLAGQCCARNVKVDKLFKSTKKIPATYKAMTSEKLHLPHAFCPLDEPWMATGEG